MKFLFIVLISLVTFCSIHSQDRYEKSMKKNLSMMDSARTVEDFLQIANGFERIALAEKDKWLPYYYSSWVYTIASFTDTTASKKDGYLDKGDKLISTADSLEPDNSEIYTLKGMIAQARMQINPMSRWQKYGPLEDEYFKKAVAIDSLNPRPDYLVGIGVYYTPEQFGGGPKKAKPILEKSLAKYNEFRPANDLMPDWGRRAVEGLLKNIAEADTTKTK
jgi:hypothetical protein